MLVIPSLCPSYGLSGDPGSSSARGMSEVAVSLTAKRIVVLVVLTKHHDTHDTGGRVPQLATLHISVCCT